ncbi:hypothetical protein ALI144C_31690 [Actinosynnema sp. ALI-1.44]|uniref:hypothetical protein n=1 Tax=Actinosynnema sp. ALI-1.44 TaxID=1933779 RepID=UPI00097CB70F|nr:hypothetical protein [Actinosynnema sp. ALI-1.44]ONI77963.1 hypothetical protein ALI144C_31690 [Actinosynnema sp. ALI-1.44]
MSTEESNLTAAPTSWVSESCTLPTAEQPLREAEFDDLFASAVRQVEQPEPGLLRLELVPTADVAETAARLVVKETACCSFFTFTLTATGGVLTLEVAVSPAHVEVLTALAARAKSVSAGTTS